MLATTSGDIVNYALAIFLIAVGAVLAFVLVKLAGVFGRVASFIRGAEREMMPVINKVGGSVDRVNHQLDKIDPATDSAVDTVVAVDETVRAVSYAVKRPIEKLLGVSAALSHGFATLRTKRSWKAATQSAKEAAARREQDFDEEVHQANPGWTPPTAVTPLSPTRPSTPKPPTSPPSSPPTPPKTSPAPPPKTPPAPAPKASPPTPPKTPPATPPKTPPGSPSSTASPTPPPATPTPRNPPSPPKPPPAD
jgi:hypothetical protein